MRQSYLVGEFLMELMAPNVSLLTSSKNLFSFLVGDFLMELVLTDLRILTSY